MKLFQAAISANLALIMLSAASFAVPAATTAPSTTEPTGLISLNFPDNVELKTFIDYASQRLSLNIVYQEEQVANQHLTIKTPTRIPADALLGLLQNLLKIKGLAMVDSDQPGLKRIVLLQASSVPTTRPGIAANQVITEAFQLHFIDATHADAAIKPFLSGPTAGSLAIPEQHLLLVTDFATDLKRIEEVIHLVDQSNENLRVEFIPVKNADAAQLGQQVKQVLQARARAQALPRQNPESNFDVTQDRRTGQLVIVGSPAQVEEAQHIVRTLDVPVTEQQSPIHFYKLANATAADVLETIRALEGEGSEPSAPRAANTPASPQNASAAYVAPLPGSQGNTAAATGSSAVPGFAGGASVPGGNPTGGSTPGLFTTSASGQTSVPSPNVASSANPPAAPAGFKTKNANVAADPNTNTIIVVAEPTVQHLYEQIIRSLDKRRPQVLIEATIVSLDTSHGQTLGVEISGTGNSGKTQTVTFSSFGFSTPNPLTGGLALTPGVGFNGAVIGSDVAEVIVRALATSNHAKVSSAPRILVNDNATGTLTSLNGEPYTTTAIGTTIATTSFGGYAQAGTSVTLTPHISESDYLQLEYQVSLSSFTTPGDPTHGIPPGVQQDAVQSKVTIPDGSTVVVGGLNRSNYSKTVQSIPFLNQIPVLKYLFSRTDDADDKATLFVFLRPIILRDDQFEDLKFLSERDLKEAGLPAGMPSSEPIAIH